jgi:hypothetical protein
VVRWLWTQKQEFGPPGAEGIVYASSRQRTIVLVNRNTWEWDGGSWVQVDDMGPLGSQALIYDTLRRRVISFATKNKVGETWEWDGVSWTQLADTGPGSRATAMAYDSVRDRVVLFGGSPVGPVDGTSTATGFFADTWEWDGEDWTQQEDQGPAGRLGHAMVYDSARKQTLMFGASGQRGIMVTLGLGMERVGSY